MGKRGRPSKNEELKTYYRIGETIKVNAAFVLKEIEKMRLFIIASINDISISPEEMLRCHKGQNSIEKGFRFLKSDTFSISNVYPRISQELKR